MLVEKDVYDLDVGSQQISQRLMVQGISGRASYHVGLDVARKVMREYQVIKALIAEDRWKGFYTGIGPSFFSTSAWGTSMILASEYVSM
ncbi:putative mitochondrial carrier domain protein [Helianthus annuus]|uniref:Mitochondrial carrier domain protein n=1 Tax=Helianthus annuus TaxID=4232 RepID=A0A9K3E3A6_HELAN|nr:putative mitochondrial carrier domain protein [Helianthus annuus]KAJ0457524.1 hypothetical protein HanIR_Chr15g0774661 [Helianthus annuus]KAJ0653826.1 hypothetical protein HanOQP8_Chr15g0587921 [Helianthus annuus]